MRTKHCGYQIAWRFFNFRIPSYTHYICNILANLFILIFTSVFSKFYSQFLSFSNHFPLITKYFLLYRICAFNKSARIDTVAPNSVHFGALLYIVIAYFRGVYRYCKFSLCERLNNFVFNYLSLIFYSYLIISFYCIFCVVSFRYSYML